MARKKRPSQGGKPWVPLYKAQLVIPAVLAAAARSDPEIAAALEGHGEVWRNDSYVVLVQRAPEGYVTVLSVRRADRGYTRDWRHLQQIKNEIAGPDVEAAELYPSELRRVDTANQTYLWCAAPGERFPWGFGERLIVGPGEGPQTGSRQRAFTLPPQLPGNVRGSGKDDR